MNGKRVGVLVIVATTTWGAVAFGRVLTGEGEWHSVSGEAIRGTWKAQLTEQEGKVTGSIDMTGSNIFSGGRVAGTLNDGGVTLGIMENGVEQASFSGKLDGDEVKGEWTCPAVKDTGVWEGTLTEQK